MSKPKRYDLQRGISHRLTLAAQLNMRLTDAALAPFGLSRIMWLTMLTIQDDEIQNPSQIAARVGINKTAVSRILTQLENKGWLTREKQTVDKRASKVMLTPQGQATLTRATPQGTQIAAHFSAKLTKDEISQLRQILGKLLEGEVEPFPME